jgi:leucine dehydrogenase
LGVFEAIGTAGHEEVLHGSDPDSGLRTIIAVHSTVLGPALGGTRFYPYPTEDDALRDVLRLSRGMTYKAAAAGLDLGGGKAVIIGNPATDRSEVLMRAYGRTVDSLGGRYLTAEDVGTTAADMALIARETRWVTGVPVEQGGSGDPSPFTARGVLAAILAVAHRLWGSEEVSGRRFAVQGVGKVGSSLASRLLAAGAEVVVSDIDPKAVDRAVEQGAKAVESGEILEVDCDVLAPCALGAVLNETTIPRLQCAAVVGAANNQLATGADAARLADAGILYVPDFVANAGGIINIAEELRGYSEARAERAVDGIYENTARVLRVADERGLEPHAAAEAVAEDRIAKVGELKRRHRAASS